MRWMVQIMGLVGMLILGIFLGIDGAEKNIQKMQGTEGAPRAIQIIPQDDGRIEISVLGQVVETKNPVEQVDKEKVEIVTQTVKEETNHLATMGNQVGQGMREVTRKIVEIIFSWVD